jgi:periplasmic divalent cation tolerance protein
MGFKKLGSVEAGAKAVSTLPKRLLIIGIESYIARGRGKKGGGLAVSHRKTRYIAYVQPLGSAAASEMTDVLLVLTTCPNAESAELIANTLVSERLAACVSQISGVLSTYIWEGQLQHEREFQLVIKTTQGQWATLAERLKSLHPYEVPELIAIPVCAGSQSYLDWVRQNTAAKS